MTNINMAGLQEAPRQNVVDVMGVSTGTFINYMIREHSTDYVNRELIQQLTRSDSCCKVVSLWIANDFPNMVKRFVTERKRKQRSGKNETRTASEDEKRVRNKFGEFLAEANRDDTEPITQNWIVELTALAEEYLKVVRIFVAKASRSIKRLSQPANVDKIHGIPYIPQTHILILNTKEVKWAEVTERLIEYAENKRSKSKQAWSIDPADLLAIVHMVRGSTAGVLIDTRQNDSQEKRVSLRAICAQLPVLAVVKDEMYVLYDIHALSDIEWLAILNADDAAALEAKHLALKADLRSRQRQRTIPNRADNEELDSNSETAVVDGANNNEEKKSSHPGALPLCKRFPKLIPTVCDFVIQNGVSAQGKRRHTGLTVGVSLREIRAHVLRVVPGLSNFGISTNSVARLFMAPHNGRRSGKDYKSYIEFKVPSKDDTMRKQNPIQHTCKAQVNCVMEMGADYRDQCHSAGLDDKAKITVGTWCVSKFIKDKNRYPAGQGPKKLDHGFVIASTWSLTVFGLMEILPHPDDHVQREETSDDESILDFSEREEKNPFRIQEEGRSSRTVSVQARQRRAGILHGIMKHQEDEESVDWDESEVVFAPAASATEQKVEVMFLPVTQVPSSSNTNTKRKLPKREICDQTISEKQTTHDESSGHKQPGDDEHSKDESVAHSKDNDSVSGEVSSSAGSSVDGTRPTQQNALSDVTASKEVAQPDANEAEQSDANETEQQPVRRQIKKKRVIASDKEEEPETDSHLPQNHSEATAGDVVEYSGERGQDSLQEEVSSGVCETHPRPPSRAHTPGANDPNAVLTTDRYGRQHVQVPSTGIGHVRIRATRFDPSTPYTHYCDIKAFLDQHPNKKPNMVLSVDGGSDFTCRGLTPLYFYFRAFLDGGLDSLTVVQNAAGYSAFNFQIERLWGRLSQELIGVLLTGTLPEHKGLTPAQYTATPDCSNDCAENKATLKAQKEAALKASYSGPVVTATDKKKAKTWLVKKMKEHNRQRKPCLPACAENKRASLKQIRKDEKLVFKNASEELKSHWQGRKYDSFDINCEVMSDDVPEDVVEELLELKRYIACCDRQKTGTGREFHNIHEFWLFLFRHLPKKQTHQISFQAQCGVKTCPHLPCHQKGSKMLQDMKRLGMPFNATPHPDRKTNFVTYLEHREREGRDQADPDAHIQLERRPKPPWTPKVCPFKLVDGENCAGHYVFGSKREEERHKKMYHSKGTEKLARFNEWKKKNEADKTVAVVEKKKRPRQRKTVYCKWVESCEFYCNERFADWALLANHHKSTGHYNQGRQTSRRPGTCESLEKETERNKAVRKKRREHAAQKKLTNLTAAVNDMGVVSTDGQCLLRAPLEKNDKQQAEVEDEEQPEQYGASLDKCTPGVFAAVQTLYDTGERGIELYKVKQVDKTVVGSETFVGIQYKPECGGNVDPACLDIPWNSSRKTESCKCWGVLVYFTKLTAKNKIPVVAAKKINEKNGVFASSATVPGQKTTADALDDDNGIGLGFDVTQSENKKEEAHVPVTEGSRPEAVKRKAALAQPNMKRKLPSQLQAGDKTMDKDTGSGDEEKVTMTNRKEGPHEDCVKNKFVVLRETYEDSSKGVDVYKIVNTTSNQVNQGFVGKHYVPSTLGLSTTDPKCVTAKWHSLGAQYVLPFDKVFLYFDSLNKGGTIPSKARAAMESESGSLFAPAPVNVQEIVKTGTSPVTGMTRYLVRMENDLLTWMEASSTARGFESTLSGWKPRHQDSVAKSSDTANEIVTGQTGKVWVSIPPYSLLKSDSDVITAGGPLNHVILDAAMTLLARQTGGFEMLSCLCPVEGYSQVQLTKPHLQIHSCGRISPHFVSSFFHNGVVWYHDNQQPDTIPSSVLVQMADLYSTGKEELIIRRLKLPRQTDRDSCGYLAFASVVEVALCPDNAGPSNLAGLQFDENLACDWLVLCLSAKRMTQCPKIPTAEGSCERPYLEFTATLEFLTRIGSGFTRSPRTTLERRGDYIGHGAENNSDADFLGDNPGTSIGQEANRRILTGSVVKLHSDDKGKRTEDCLWVVTSVDRTDHSVQLTPLDESTHKQERRIGPGSTLTVVGPPCLRCVEMFSLSAFDLIQPAKLVVVYPVHKGLMSNTAFHSKKINEYTWLEATVCRTQFDVECMLRVMAKKEVKLLVKITHLFPTCCMEGYYSHRTDLTNIRELYDTVLAAMLDNYEVKVGASLGSIGHQHISAYPSGMQAEEMQLPPFRPVSEFIVHRLPRDNGLPSRQITCEVTIPDMGAKGVFRDSSMTDVVKWVLATSTQKNTKLLKTSAVQVQLRSLVSDDLCELCYVVAGKIRSMSSGAGVSTEQSELLKKSCVKFVEKVEEYLHGAQKTDQEVGSWAQVKDTTWGVYRVRMYVEKNAVMVADVRGVDAPYDRQLRGITDAVCIKGLMGFGGQKLVLSATYTRQTQTDDVVLYRPRDTSCNASCVDFQREMFLLAKLKFTEKVLRLTHSDEANLWAMTTRMTGPISRRLRGVDKKQRLGIAVDLLIQCAEALTQVHDNRIIHRDVKPDNFLYEMDKICKVKIADFGCAVELQPGVDTTTGNIGTRSYKAPEVSLSEKYNQKVDVYSFGVMVWELVYRKRRSTQLKDAFDKVKDEYTSMEAYAEIVCTPPCTGKFGAHIDKVIRECTDKNPVNRPLMKTVSDTLKQLHRHKSIVEIQNNPEPTIKSKRKTEFESVLSS